MPHIELQRRHTASAVPQRAWALSEWSLLPLRLFLGVTFVFASLNKLANPSFFSAASPTSIQAQMRGAARVSPLHSLLHPLIAHAVVIGWLIAYGELAIGLGTLLGLKTRVAAAAGALLSLSLFLTVSFHASPYFTGSDIVFLFAWLPLIIAGGGTRWSCDGLIARVAARTTGAATSDLVVMPFATLRTLCGHYERGACAARSGEACDDSRCPVLASSKVADPSSAALDRRTLVLGSTAVALAAGTAVAVGSATSSLGHLEANATAKANVTTPSTTTTLVPGGGGATGVAIGPVRSLPVGAAATFTVPSTGDPGLVVRVAEKEFVAYDAVCPHMGCTVAYAPSAGLIACPCHGSQFALLTGQLIQGPAPHGLTPLDVVESSSGELYLK